MGRPYTTARLRFQRGIEHGELLTKRWNSFPSTFVLTPALLIGNDGLGVLKAVSVGEVPDDVSLILGEFLYQLRSALDACVYQASIYATGEDPPPNETAIEFPIMSNPEDWPRLVKRRLFALPDWICDGLEGMQPFTAEFLSASELVASPGRALGILNDLARKDRHRQLHVVGSWPSELKPEFVLPVGVALDWFETMPPSIIAEGTVLGRFALNGFSADMTVAVVPNLTVDLGCAEPPPPCHPSDTFSNRMRQMINAVKGVLTAFEKNY